MHNHVHHLWTFWHKCVPHENFPNFVLAFHGVSFAFVVLTANLIWWRIRSTSAPGFIPTAHRAGLADCDHVPHQPEVHEIHPSVDQRRICGIPGSS